MPRHRNALGRRPLRRSGARAAIATVLAGALVVAGAGAARAEADTAGVDSVSAEATPAPLEASPSATAADEATAAPATDEPDTPERELVEPAVDAAREQGDAREAQPSATPAGARTAKALLGTAVPATPTSASGLEIAWLDGDDATRLTLQAALTAAADGAVVHVEPGSWTWGTTALNVPRNVTVTADDETHLYARFTMAATSTGLAFGDDVLVRATAGPIVQVNRADATVKGLHADNPNAIANLSAVATNGAKNGVTITGLRFDNAGGTGSSYGVNASTSAGLTVTDVAVTHTTYGVAATPGSGGAGATVSDATITTNAGGTGLSLASASSGVRVSDVTVDTGSSGTGIAVSTTTGASITDATITGTSGNGIAGTSSTNLRVGGGVSIAAVGGSGIGLASSTGATIAATTITGTATTGIGANPSAGLRLDPGVSITTATTGTGVNLTNATDAQLDATTVLAASTGLNATGTNGVTVEDATLTGTGYAGTGVNVATGKRVRITDSTVSSYATGISLSSGDATISGSRIAAKGTGITLGSSTGSRVESSTITSESRSSGSNGLMVATSTDAVVVDNTIVGQDTALDLALDDLTPTAQGSINTSAYGLSVAAAKGLRESGSNIQGYYDGVYASASSGDDIRLTGTRVSKVRYAAMWFGGMKITNLVIDHPHTNVDGYVDRASLGTTHINVGNSPAAQVIEPDCTGNPRWGVYAPTGAGAGGEGIQITGGDIWVHEGGVGFGTTVNGSIVGTTIHMMTDPATDRSGGHSESHGVNFDASIGTVVDGIRIVTAPGYAPTRNGIYARANRSSTLSNAVIKNNYVEASSYAVEMATSTGLVVEGNTFVGNGTLVDQYSGAAGTWGDKGPTMAVNMHNAQSLTVKDNTASGFGMLVGGTGTGANNNLTIEHNDSIGQPAGVFLLNGSTGGKIVDNTFTGLTDYGMKLAPAHDVTVAGNAFEYTGDKGVVWVATDTANQGLSGSYSSSGITVTRNTFTGNGPYVLVGSNVAAGNLKDRRALRDTLVFSDNRTPRASTAIQVWDNASGIRTGDTTGTNRDKNADNNQIADPETGLNNVAVDARVGNDWDSACGPMVKSDAYRGRGSGVTENGGVDGEKSQVLYPTCHITLGAPTLTWSAGWGTNPFGSADRASAGLGAAGSGTSAFAASGRGPFR